MLVEGSPGYRADPATLLRRLRARLETLRPRTPGPPPPLDGLRTLLVRAGEFEQAAGEEMPVCMPGPAARAAMDGLRAVTDAAAAAFYARWRMTQAETPHEEPAAPMARMAAALAGLPPLLAGPGGHLRGHPLTVRIAVGFAFEAFYPEQYVMAARRWLADPAQAPGTVLVVGIGPAGASLSAVVAAALASAGREVRRCSLRPGDNLLPDPAAIEPARWAGGDRGIVVGEGSLTSGPAVDVVAGLLARLGPAPDRIALFPGPAGEAASVDAPGAPEWWQRAPRFTVPVDDLRWDGRSLRELLAWRTATIPGCGAPVERIEDLGARRWRRLVAADPARWPPAVVPFERPKFRCVMSDGRAVLWKFHGFASSAVSRESGAEAAFHVQLERAAGGWMAPALAVADGFVATPWIDGVPLAGGDADPPLIAHLGRYVAAAAGPPLVAAEQVAGRAGLARMLCSNSRSALGSNAAARARAIVEQLEADTAPLDARACGDGRLAPHEWVRLPEGRVLKVDGTGHDLDRTTVGPQPVAWDVAGACVEWDLDDPAIAALLAAFRAAGGGTISPAALRFYRAAYAAFRTGLLTLSAAAAADDPEEAFRRKSGAARCRRRLARILGSDVRR